MAQAAAGPVVAKAKASAAQNETFFSIVFSGGLLGIGIMLALIGLSLITVYLIVDQALTLRKKDILPSDFADSIRQLLARVLLSVEAVKQTLPRSASEMNHIA